MVPLTSPLIHVAGLETTHVACPAMPEPSLDAQVAWGRPFLFLHMSISYPKTPCTLAHFASELGAVIFHSEKRNKKFRIFVSFVFTPMPLPCIISNLELRAGASHTSDLP